jgi:general secretion pathway protein J
VKERGFTLVEVLVALTIFALMSVLAYRGLTAVLETRAHVSDDNRRWREIALTLDLFEQDLGAVVERPVRDAGDLVQPAFVGDPLATDDDAAPLIFSRTGSAWQTGSAADVQRHGYRLRAGTLEQMVWPVLDQAPHSAPTVHPLIEGVERLELRYLDAAGNWQPRWPLPGLQTGLPAAVEVVVEIRRAGRITRVFALP